MTLIMLAAVWKGRSGSDFFDFEAAYHTILVATAVNWCLRLISESMEERLMRLVHWIEEKIRDVLITLVESAVACVRGIWAWLRGKTFPPILDV